MTCNHECDRKKAMIQIGDTKYHKWIEILDYLVGRIDMKQSRPKDAH